VRVALGPLEGPVLAYIHTLIFTCTNIYLLTINTLGPVEGLVLYIYIYIANTHTHTHTRQHLYVLIYTTINTLTGANKPPKDFVHDSDLLL
jgi:hypothetical protein